MIPRLLDKRLVRGPPKHTFKLHPTWSPRLLGSTWPASLPASQRSSASPSASQPAAIQCASNSVQSPSKLPGSPSKPQKPMNTNIFHWLLPCQPGCLQHPFWMPEPSKVIPSDVKMESTGSQALPKWSLETPTMIANAPMWTHGAQFEPTVNPGTPKTHTKTSKMLPKWGRKVNNSSSATSPGHK